MSRKQYYSDEQLDAILQLTFGLGHVKLDMKEMGVPNNMAADNPYRASLIAVFNEIEKAQIALEEIYVHETALNWREYCETHDSCERCPIGLSEINCSRVLKTLSNDEMET